MLKFCMVHGQQIVGISVLTQHFYIQMSIVFNTAWQCIIKVIILFFTRIYVVDLKRRTLTINICCRFEAENNHNKMTQNIKDSHYHLMKSISVSR